MGQPVVMDDDATASTEGWRPRVTDVGVLRVPATWVDDTHEDAIAVVTSADPLTPTFRENVVLSAVPTQGSITADSLAAIDETRRAQVWTHIVAVSPWSQGNRGRRMIFLYEIDRVVVAVAKYTFTSGDQRIDLTCSADLTTFTTLLPIFDEIAAFSELSNIAERELTNQSGDQLPVLDAAATARFGEPLESLDFLRGSQVAPSADYVLPAGSLDQLWSTKDRGLVSTATRSSEVGTALREAGLTSRFGGSTTKAREVIAPLQTSTFRLASVRQSAGETQQWSCFAAPDGLALVRSQSTTVHATSPESLSIVGLPAAIARLIAWLPLDPYWAVIDEADRDRVFDDDLLNAKLCGERVPSPERLGPVLEECWSADWVSVQIGMHDSTDGLPLIQANGKYFHRDATGGGSLLRPVPSDTVFLGILDLVGRHRSRGAS